MQPHAKLYIPLTYNVWNGLAGVARSPAANGPGTEINPYVFHAANVLVHTASALLVFAILRPAAEPAVDRRRRCPAVRLAPVTG